MTMCILKLLGRKALFPNWKEGCDPAKSGNNVLYNFFVAGNLRVGGEGQP